MNAFDSFYIRSTIDNYARQEKLACYRKQQYSSLARLSGLRDTPWASLSTDAAIVVFWRATAAIVVLSAGPDQEDRIDEAFGAFRFAAACGLGCVEQQRTYFGTLLNIATPSLADQFGRIWAQHAPYLAFPSQSMARARALATLRPMRFYASIGDDNHAVRAMTHYLDVLLDQLAIAVPEPVA